MGVDRKSVKKYLKASYQKNSDVKLAGLDKKLSGKRVKVFYNPETKKSVVVHRGTASARDWVKTNVPMALGFESGNRFKHAKKIQKKAEAKYGSSNVTTMGHSLGGRLAEKVGKKSASIITYNKAATPKSIRKKTPKNQQDIRTSRDVVSLLSTAQKHSNKPITLKSKSLNPIAEHAVEKIR